MLQTSLSLHLEELLLQSLKREHLYPLPTWSTEHFFITYTQTKMTETIRLLKKEDIEKEKIRIEYFGRSMLNFSIGNVLYQEPDDYERKLADKLLTKVELAFKSSSFKK